MLVEAQVGKRILADGAEAYLRLARSGALVATMGYTERAIRDKNLFLAANSATQALSVNSATATGIILTNPPNSNVLVALQEVHVALASLPAAQSALILTGSANGSQGAVTHTTPLTVRNAYLTGGDGPQALVDSSATLPVQPVIVRVLGGGPAATIVGSTAWPPFIEAIIGGSIVLPPGGYISLQALTTAITVVASILWSEEPV